MTAEISIIIPLYNDEDWVAGALDSCLRQTLRDIEIICVDDASTDGTAQVVAEYAARDARVRVIRQPQNASAFQARRAGIEAASAPFVLFLDGDDELAPQAAKVALAKAKATGADVVGFGVSIVTADDNPPRRFEAALQPVHDELLAPEIIPSIFPVGVEANGHLWRYLFATSLLRSAYAGFPSDATYYRANDLPITFLTLARAKKYVSVRDRLYRYNFQRGTSGHAIDSMERLEFMVSGIDPITAIEPTVRALGDEHIVESYESARLHIIGNVLKYCLRDATGAFQQTCLTTLDEKVGALQVIRAAVRFQPGAMPALSAHAVTTELAPREHAPRTILLTTSHLDTGGLQNVMRTHAAQLVQAGYTVIIAVYRPSENDVDVPDGVEVIHLAGRDPERVDQWVQICQDRDVELIIDHHILYNTRWPWYVLAARTLGIPAVGWIHNFALRPLFDHSRHLGFLTTHLPTLSNVVTLSPTDVAFWKLQGVEHVVYLPNPASELALRAYEGGSVRSLPEGRLELAWWGRLDRATKQVLDLVDLAVHLKSRDVDFRLTIIGPDSKSLSSDFVRQCVADKHVDDVVRVLPGMQPDELFEILTQTHLMVSASAIEGYQLTIVEAQALGIPVAMYDLPWLSTVRGNDGLVITEPGNAAAMAGAIAELAHDAERYERLSRAGREFADATISIDTSALLEALVVDELPAAYSPEPTLDDSRIITSWLVTYAERSLRHFDRQNRALNSRTGEVAKLRRDSKELAHIKRGASFRIGRALTMLPRAVVKLVRPTKKR